MKLRELAPGMVVREALGDELVRVVKIHETKHYGKARPVCVRFANRHTAYYAPEDLAPPEPTP